MQTGEELQREKTSATMSDVPGHHERVGLGGYVSVPIGDVEEDTDMPDITREKFPDRATLTGMLSFQHYSSFSNF